MVFRILSIVLLVSSLFGTGCNRPQSKSSATAAKQQTSVAAAPAILLETIARLHWQGSRQLDTQTNAADLLTILKLPETAKLKAQTLDKLALAPWILSPDSSGTNVSRLLRPLLDDVISVESYLEVRQGSNGLLHFVWALRLNDTQAAVWNTNLNLFLKSFAGAKPSAGKPGALVVPISNRGPCLFESRRAHGWTVLSLTPEPSAFFEAVVSRLDADAASPVVWTSNYWFEVEVDLDRLPISDRASWPDHLPKVGVSVIGDGKDLRIDGELNFPQPLNLNLEPWKVPVEVIDGGLSSFTAIRGFGSWLNSLKPWRDLKFDLTPNQAFGWALRGLQMQTYFAVPLMGASNQVAKLTDHILAEGGPWRGTNDLAGFQKAQGFDGFEWKGLPYIWPFVRSSHAGTNEIIYAGLFPGGDVYSLSPDALRVLNPTNIFYYDWEVSSARVEQWLYIAQFARLVSQKAQLEAGSASALWLKAIAAKLGNSMTQGTVTGPAQISVVRKSSVGLTGIELQLLGDWLESPDFPLGLHTFHAKPSPQP